MTERQIQALNIGRLNGATETLRRQHLEELAHLAPGHAPDGIPELPPLGPFDQLRQLEPVLGLSGKSRPRTPTMALGLTDRVLTVGDLLRMSLIPTSA